jgi:hypothetical protein
MMLQQQTRTVLARMQMKDTIALETASQMRTAMGYAIRLKF